MAVKALGKDRVCGVALLCNSKVTDLEDAKMLASELGIDFKIMDLTDSYEMLKNEINSKLGGNMLSEEALINMKPRLRMMSLYSIAQTLGYLVIGTGNLSEAMVRLYNKMGRQCFRF